MDLVTAQQIGVPMFGVEAPGNPLKARPAGIVAELIQPQEEAAQGVAACGAGDGLPVPLQQCRVLLDPGLRRGDGTGARKSVIPATAGIQMPCTPPLRPFHSSWTRRALG